MVALSLSVLALAAGVFLLVKVKSQYLGKLFEGLAWLVIVLALVAIGAVGYHALHHCGGGECGKGDCKTEQKECSANQQTNMPDHCTMGNMGDMAACCKAEGDSMVMDAASCEKMMGKEACEKMMKERGRCIMSKEECAKACEANGTSDCCKKDAGTCSHMGSCPYGANCPNKGNCSADASCKGKCGDKAACPANTGNAEKPACCKKDK